MNFRINKNHESIVHRIGTILISQLCIVLLFSGCDKTELPSDKTTVIDGHIFELSVHLDKHNFLSDEEFIVSADLSYLGPDESICINTGDPIVRFNILAEDSKGVLQGQYDVRMYTTLLKNERQQFPLMEYFIGGETFYTADGIRHIEITPQDDDTAFVSCSAGTYVIEANMYFGILNSDPESTQNHISASQEITVETRTVPQSTGY